MDKVKLNVADINRLIENGNEVLKTQTTAYMARSKTPYGIVDGFKYGSWRTQVLNYIAIQLNESNQYYISLNKVLPLGAYPGHVKGGIAHLEMLIEDIQNGVFIKQDSTTEPIALLNNIFDKFHKVAVKLRGRYDSRATLDISDEYDVQDLLHALLMLQFDDVQPEDWTPSYAGSSSRLDFALREHNIVIEVKKTRASLKNKDVSNQLIIDIERYRSYPSCKHLICFVYDPDGYISNPKGFENDLNREREGLNVMVIVRPRH